MNEETTNNKAIFFSQQILSLQPKRLMTGIRNCRGTFHITIMLFLLTDFSQ